MTKKFCKLFWEGPKLEKWIHNVTWDNTNKPPQPCVGGLGIASVNNNNKKNKNEAQLAGWIRRFTNERQPLKEGYYVTMSNF